MWSNKKFSDLNENATDRGSAATSLDCVKYFSLKCHTKVAMKNYLVLSNRKYK